jgi:hypothetical protein
MEQAGSRGSPSKKVRVGGATAGAGGGTLLVLIANSLPERSVWKPWVLATAPTITVALSTASSWGAGRFVHFIKNKRFLRAIAKAKRKTEEGLKKEGASPKQKALMRRHLEELQKIEVTNEMQLIRNLARFDEDIRLPHYATQNLVQSREAMAVASDEKTVPPDK